MKPPRAPAQSGFTLLEILIAVLILGLIVAGITQGARFGIEAWNFQNRIIERAAVIERTDRLLRLLVEQAAPPLAADDKPFQGEAHRAIFITRLPASPHTDPVRRAQVAIGVDADHRLILRWQPHPNAVALKPLPPPETIVLAEDVDHFDLSYRQAVADGGKWQATWSDSSLPALVTMHIVPRNAALRWPAVEAATMLDTNGSF